MEILKNNTNLNFVINTEQNFRTDLEPDQRYGAFHNHVPASSSIISPEKERQTGIREIPRIPSSNFELRREHRRRSPWQLHGRAHHRFLGLQKKSELCGCDTTFRHANQAKRRVTWTTICKCPRCHQQDST